ncbi:MAG: tetratricopeptide repeat protein [Lentimonas sp.]
MARYYETGTHTQTDLETAINDYERAAHKGHALAQNNLAVKLIEAGKETEDSPRVIELLEASCAQKNLYAMNHLGYRIITNTIPGQKQERGLRLLFDAAERKHRRALLNLIDLSKRNAYTHLFSDEQIQALKQLNETTSN